MNLHRHRHRRPEFSLYGFTKFGFTKLVFVFALMAAGLAQAAGTELQAQKAATYDLIAYLKTHVVVRDSDSKIPKYDRLHHFGGWRAQDGNGKCRRTRETVLMRDADHSRPLEQDATTCKVTVGVWHDPYTGTEFYNSSDVQIDHVVPLKHAFDMGAHAWRPAKRCHYANFVANSFHLMAVSGHENMSKGDKAPDRYMPPATSFHCTYLNTWMKIKIIWGLSATASEVQSIEQDFAAKNCPRHLRYVQAQEVESQKAASEQPIYSCVRFENSRIAKTAPGADDLVNDDSDGFSLQ